LSQRHGRHFWAAALVAVCIVLGGSSLALGEVRFGIGVAVPGLSIGINIPAYPQLVPIPGYPVYYAPGVGANLFFYDGLYWVFSGDDWYYSSWYDGPWYVSQPEMVPDFVLRIPILYYRRPPAYFLGWNRSAAPRWGEHWGPAWEERRRGWDHWDRRSIPPRAPLPGYQRQYPHDRYPGADRRQNLENRLYPYRPRDPRDRSRPEQAPPFGRRIAPQPNRPAPELRPGAPPGAHHVPPGAMQPHGNPGPPSQQQPRNAPQPHSDRGHHPSNRPPG
jgi:hypothetical protein